MKASLNWISQFVKLPDKTGSEIAADLTMSTVEIENVVSQADLYNNVVVGKVNEVVRHPKADRLWVCSVEVKETEELQIICGGTNIKKDMLVAVAKVGSKVRWHGEGDLIELSKAKIRGIESNGMIAAANELGLDKLFPGGTEKEILDLSSYNLKPGESISKALGLMDIIFEVDNKSMTHRPDLWGQYGLAREVAAIYNHSLKPLKTAQIPKIFGDIKPLKIVIKDKEHCLRFSGLVIDNVQPIDSPWWLKRDLEAVGIGSTNSVVDVTNYVMMTLGQPMHAYDYDMLSGHSLIVEQAGAKQKFEALNDETYNLSKEMLLIKDSKKVLGVAGIIGGIGSAISDLTKTIALEAAHFTASSIRTTSVALGLRTDASARFEKSLDYEMPPQAIALAAELILRIHPEAKISSELIDVSEKSSENIKVSVTHEFIEKRLGVEIDVKEVVSIFKRLGLTASNKKSVYEVLIPSFRQRDLKIQEDLVEEVARIYGYGKVEPTMPVVTIASPSRDVIKKFEREIKYLLTDGFHYSEVRLYSFADTTWSEKLGFNKDRVSVKNFLTPNQEYMRPSLLPQLIKCAEENLRWYDEFNIFELGRVFTKKAGEYSVDGTAKAFLPSQSIMMSGLSVSKDKTPEQLYRGVKGMMESIAQKMNVSVAYTELKGVSFGKAVYEIKNHDKSLGRFGLFKQNILNEDFGGASIAWWDIDFGLYAKFVNFSRAFKPLPKYPSIERDIAALVNSSVAWKDIENIVSNCSPMLKEVELFDTFVSAKLGKNKKSVAFRMTFASEEKTLESSEVDAVIARLSKKLSKEFGAQVR